MNHWIGTDFIFTSTPSLLHLLYLYLHAAKTGLIIQILKNQNNQNYFIIRYNEYYNEILIQIRSHFISRTKISSVLKHR